MELQSAKERNANKDEFSEMVEDAFIVINNYMAYLTLKRNIEQLRILSEKGHETEINAWGRVEALKQY